MMVKDVTKFHKHYLGGRHMLEYMCVFTQDFEFGEGGNSEVRS